VRGSCLETALGCFSPSEPLPEGTLVDVMVRPEEVDLTPWPPSLKGRGTLTRPPLPERERDEEMSEGLVVARRYRGGMQFLTVRLASGEVVRSLQPAGAHFPLASRVRVRVKTQTPLIFPR
ncbi:MAG: TOBE domain-containing protein, partial [Candidatus Bipolaricaulota bacterium]|nr:TOBE domain-containing protein [Candidatus Bipolaricaulota bacterium]